MLLLVPVCVPHLQPKSAYRRILLTRSLNNKKTMLYFLDFFTLDQVLVGK